MNKRFTSIKLILSMVFIICTLLPISPVNAESAAVYVLSYPSKITYEFGEAFDTTGFQIVTADKKQTNVNNKITFYTSNTVELTQGRKFQTDGVKIIELRYNGNKIGAYEITVNKQVAAPTRESGTEVTIESFPSKTVYQYNEIFDTTGLKVVTNNSNKTDVTNKIIFTSTVYGWELTKNYKMDFSNRAEYRIALRYNGKKIGEYSFITLGDPIYATEAIENITNGWKSLHLGDSSENTNFVTIDANGNAELREGGSYYKYYTKDASVRGADGSNYKFYWENRGITNNRKVQVTLKMPDGKYLGIDSEVKNGVQLKVVNHPYVWFYDGNRGYLYPPAYSNMLANASGESYKDGTKIILWNQPYSIYTYHHASFDVRTTSDPAGIKAGLYRLAGMGGHYQALLFDKIDGNIVGYLTYPSVVLKVTESKGDWAKITFNGRSHYVSNRLTSMTKVNNPDIVCSPWAKKWWEYTGAIIGTTTDYSKVKTDWTKSITNDDMADLLVGLMIDIYGDWIVRYSTSFTKNWSKISWDSEASDINYVKDRLFRWGVFTDTKMKWKANPTYGEFTTYLTKLMEFDKKAHEGIGNDLTTAIIKKFTIGGDTKTKAKITKEQAHILCEKVLDWYTGNTVTEYIKYAQDNPTHSALSQSIGTGVYTIRSQLGKKPNLIINKDGKGELNAKQKQKFKITYLGGARNTFGDWKAKYTIQTMDGKYLALSSAFKNGSRLITQDKPYVWNITENVIGQVVIRPWENPYQLLNASASKTSDGTHVITWFWDTGENGLVTPESNCDFRFTYVGKK